MLQALDDPARPLDGWRLLPSITPLGDLQDQRVQRLDAVEVLQRLPARGKNLITIFAVDQCGERHRQRQAEDAAAMPAMRSATKSRRR